jgi:SRSO17 transposase
VDRTLGEDDGVLILDGSDFPKQGQASVGVKRQYCGEVGKRANCQAGVYLAYASRKGYTLLDRRLYLPQEWVQEEAYAARRRRCGVPADLPFTTKPMLGWEMLQAVHQASTLRCRWVTCDEAFGRDTALLDRIDALGLWYLAEIPHDTQVWQQRPVTGRPAWSGRGRPPTRVRVLAGEAAPATVAELATMLPADRWRRHTIKEGSKGPLVATFARRRVIAVREGLPGPEVWLVLRRNPLTGELKAYLSNAPAETSQMTLVRMSGLRWPIETCFEEGKQYLGMGDYEVRSWRGWHHHMTLCILAHFFLARTSLRLKKLRPA